MMYNSEKDKIREMQETFGTGFDFAKMAKVMSVESNRPIIRFYGENVNAVKKYPYLSSYPPAVGDTVVLIKIGRSYVIIGKVV